MPELRRRRPFVKTIQQFAHAEVVDRGAEEYRRQLGGKVLPAIEIRAGHLQQLDLVAQLLVDTAEAFPQTGSVQTVDGPDTGDALLVAPQPVHTTFGEVINPLKDDKGQSAD